MNERGPLHPLTMWRSRQVPQRTLVSLAADLGVWPSHLSQIENWKRTPSLELAGRLNSLTGIPIKKFIRPEPAQCA